MPAVSGERALPDASHHRKTVKRLVCALALVVLVIPVRAAADITLDSVYTKEPPWGRMIDRVSWSPTGKQFLYVRRSQDPTEALSLMLCDAATGVSRVWLAPGVFGGKAATPQVLDWSPDGTSVALLAHGALYWAAIANPRPRRIAADVDDALWSPRGDSVAYSSNADLYVATLRNRLTIRRVTRGGVAGDLLDGTLDWVYPEELGIAHGFRWAPDGSQIAYLTLDERRVTNFPIVDFLTVNNGVDRERYPLAGQANPRVTLRAVNLATDADRLIYDASRRDEYVANFDWIPHSNRLEAEILDRAQHSLRFEVWSNARGAPTRIYYQTSASWVDVQPLPFWLADGRSVWLLDRQRTAGLYLRARDGSLRSLTGTYRVTDLYGVGKNATVYFGAAYPTRRDRSLLAISLNDAASSLRNLTPAPGSHETVIAPTDDRFVDVYSRLNDPPRAELVAVGSLASKMLAPESAALKAQLLPARMLEISSSYGPLDAILIGPPGFVASKRYPVVMYVYGGPDAPTTADRFGGLYDQLLAREGIVVFSIDGPASQVDSDQHMRLLFHNFGPGSLLGQEIGARYLASLPYVDPARIGIWGWSFGGYETCYALTHSRLFAAGAAVAPVTDWHFYDTIYTERYMGLPNQNAQAYARSSVLNAADHLNGPLLIQHGTSDDNVHITNSMELVERFILARESRVLFYPYPRKTHSIRGLPQQRSVFAHMLDFWKSVLNPE
jgi:dipeptidyl-peptidase 4